MNPVDSGNGDRRLGRAVAAAVAAAALALALAAPANAGRAITRLAPCVDEDMALTGVKDLPRYRAAVLCLIGQVRASQGLNRLTASPLLQRAAQGWATKQARTGRADHGASVNDIITRITAAGYRGDALNEGLGLGAGNASPYEILENMMEAGGPPCAQLLDPRFRDAGVGASVGTLRGSPGRVMHVVVTFGLPRGERPPSRNTRPSRSCPHRMPPHRRPTSPVEPFGSLSSTADSVTLSVRCTASKPCVFTATLRLVGQGATSALPALTLAAGASQGLTFPFDAAALAAARQASLPLVELTLASTAPVAFTDSLTAPLPAG